MPVENQSLWADFMQAIATSSLVGLAAWGAAGGATSGLLVRVSRWELARHIIIGALVSAGLGAMSLPMIIWALNIPHDSISPGIGGLAGSSAYMAGVIIPGVFEVILTRMKRGVLPSDKDQSDA